MKDFLIVGFGLAGMSMASVLERHRHTFEVIDYPSAHKHRVIGGMYNPIILKRFSPAWRAHDFWTQSLDTYEYFEEKFDEKFIKPFHIYRILQSVEEQNNWIVASDKVVMNQYMTTPVVDNFINGITADFGLGKLEHVGRVEGERILEYYTHELMQKGLLSQETFDYNLLQLEPNHVIYKTKTYQKVIFSEGSFVNQNPFFNYLPMKVSKGEMLIIHVPDLVLTDTLKSKVFMVPLGNQLFIVGSTYHWEERTQRLTTSGKNELEMKLKSFLQLPYTIVDYKAGVRPTVSDRRPLIGQHPEYKSLYLLNGLGTRGIIYAPALAEILYGSMVNEQTVDNEMNLKRFENYYQSV